MAGVDIFSLFPKSKMAAAVKSGLSQFRSGESVSIPATLNVAATPPSVAGGDDVAIITPPDPVLKSGTFTVNTPGVLTTAAMLSTVGFTTKFTSIAFFITASTAGVSFAQGAGSTVHPQGTNVAFSDISGTNNPVTVTLVAGDVVSVTYSGY